VLVPAALARPPQTVEKDTQGVTVHRYLRTPLVNSMFELFEYVGQVSLECLAEPVNILTHKSVMHADSVLCCQSTLEKASPSAFSVPGIESSKVFFLTSNQQAPPFQRSPVILVSHSKSNLAWKWKPIAVWK
jgi:hypothetical protein